ncbi:Gfo/Idh/MocA family protein, partial [Streptomyces avermitilis]
MTARPQGFGGWPPSRAIRCLGQRLTSRRWSADHVHAHSPHRVPSGTPASTARTASTFASTETEIVAAVDIDADAITAFCAEHGIPHAYTDLDRMLQEQRPDLVSICTPPTLHREQTLAALRAGAWVWCEKPPVPTLADFDAIESQEGTDGGPYAAIVFQHRFGSG